MEEQMDSDDDEVVLACAGARYVVHGRTASALPALGHTSNLDGGLTMRPCRSPC
jgi:hypothetical protein